MKRIFFLAITLLLLSTAVSAAGIPGDADGNGILSEREYTAALLTYLIGEGDLTRIDVQDAAWVLTHRDGRSLTVTDSSGKTQTLSRPLRRVVVFSGEALETFRSLGFDMDRIVAIDKYSHAKTTFFPEYAEKPDVGSWLSPDMERIITLRPDAIILYATISTGACDEIQRKLEASNPEIKVFRFDFFKPATYPDEIRTIAAITGCEDRGEEFAGFYTDVMDRIQTGMADIPESEKIRVYFEYWSDYKTFAAGSGYNEKLEIAGGYNPFGKETTEYPEIDPEAVIVSNPEVVVKLAGQQLVAGGYVGRDIAALEATRSAIIKRPGWSRLAAVADDRVHVIHSDILGGAQHFIGTAYLAKWFYPERFTDLDPNAIHQRYLTEFQRIDFNLADEGAFIYP